MCTHVQLVQRVARALHTLHTPLLGVCKVCTLPSTYRRPDMGNKGNRNRPKPLTVSKYLEAVAKLVEAAKPAPGSVTVIEVIHDPACPLLAGAGECTCNPTVRMTGTQ